MLKFDENNNVISEESYMAILVGVQTNEDISYSMEELKGLAEAVNATVLGSMIQKIEKPNSRTFIGKGKVLELKEMINNMEADTVIFNDELSGMELRNLEDELGVSVIDRTILILDIFARRATSREGKLQVELAQLKYRLPRLIGFGKSLSRLGGGIGTRGPGEKKLEVDRRHIEKRIDEIRKELEEIKNTRKTQRKKQEKNEIPVVSLVGYTNSGKSCLMNNFLKLVDKEDKDVFEKNMLFATLDTSKRNIKLDTNHEFILIDTVGFVSKLPHSLVEAFKSTLEEVKFSDLLIHVIDSSCDTWQFQMDVTENVLDEIGAKEKDRILAFNKIDLLNIEEKELLQKRDNSVFISAKLGDGVDELISLIKSKVFSNEVTTKILIPFNRGDISSYLMDKAKIESVSYIENGTLFSLTLKDSDYNRFKMYEVE